MNNFSPDVVLSKINLNKNDVYVVRDDYLIGGTKQRAAVPFLNYCKKQGYSEFCYASPFSGFAQIALSISANICNVKSKIFAEINPNTQQVSCFTKKSMKYSKVELFDNLQDATLACKEYVSSKENVMEIPLGFDNSIYKEFLIQELKNQWSLICNQLNFVPKRIWLPLGSGTLIKSFNSFLPEETQINCVNVNVLNDDDDRIKMIKSINRLNYFKSPLLFAESCQDLPPVPSNVFYDAKIWSILSSNVMHQDLWWNVAS